jgi:hypothetical protein
MPPAPTRKVDKITGKLSTGFKFFTRSFPCLNIYREWFYPQGIKIVPTGIADHLTPLGLAHWYMQDGYNQRNCAKFATNSFTEAECNLLIEVLYSKFGLSYTLHRTSDIGHNVYVRRESMSRFVELVKPFMHSSMFYKFPPPWP